MSVEVKVDTEGCIWCGACIAICPNVFKFNENNKSYVEKQPESSEEVQCAKEAEAACPVNVIHVKD